MTEQEKHIDRMRNVFKDALPDENTDAFKKLKTIHDKRFGQNPEFLKESKKRFETANYSLIAQDSSQSGLITSTTIRHFLKEFNTRTWEHGLRTLPIMFNILESFFKFHKSIIYFELLEEEDYVFSFFDFLDFVNSKNFKEDTNLIKENIESDLIYHYNVGADIDNITFKTTDGEEFVIGGISIIRRTNEVTVLLTTGLIFDISTVKIYKEEDYKPIPGKEKIKFDSEKGSGPELLNNNPKYWRTLAACRFDLDSDTIDARYVAKEYENSFTITTDEIIGFLKSDGKFISEEFEGSYKKNIIEIEKYNALFEVAKLALYLPYYFNQFEDDLIVEDHETEFKSLNNKPLEKRKFRNIPSRLKHIYKQVFILNIENKFSPDRIKIRDDLFKIETTGYWKNLSPDEFGTDKKGIQITGRTWITNTQSWFEAKTDELVVENKEKQYFVSENAGFIYILRNPTMESNIFKIGLTTKTVDERAQQLSKTSVPDRFYKMNEWNVKDCHRAEKEIHQILKDNRIDPKREFFRIDIDKAINVISEVINKINKED